MKLLILDDDENRHKGFRNKFFEHDRVHVHSAKECIKQLDENGPWDYVFLDHDLSHVHYEAWYDMVKRGHTEIKVEGTGMDVAEWLEKNPKKKPANIIIHSLNKPGADNMMRALPEAKHVPWCWVEK